MTKKILSKIGILAVMAMLVFNGCVEVQNIEEDRADQKQEAPDLQEPTLPTDPTIKMSYDHVKPGRYSEIYTTVTMAPFTNVKATLSSTGMTEEEQETVADKDGVANFKWRIYSFGTYKSTVAIDKNEWTESIVVGP